MEVETRQMTGDIQKLDLVRSALGYLITICIMYIDVLHTNEQSNDMKIQAFVKFEFGSLYERLHLSVNSPIV